jgi:uracil-DNA glycosylase
VTATSTAEPFLPTGRSLRTLAKAAADCRGCELYQNASQTVFGAGLAKAKVVFVGEQPGDMEDRQGKPFVGPAGRILDRALAEAGIDRDAAYLTNAVKHFRWKSTSQGKRRIHDKPDAGHVMACRPWLAAELATVRPHIVVALGATAAHALLGSSFRLTARRGELLDWPPERGPYADDETPVRMVTATVHPAAILRGDPSDRDNAFQAFVNDLKVVARALE